jgi:hypothetical protein
MGTMTAEEWDEGAGWAQADVRFEPNDSPAILDMLDETPTGDNTLIVLGSPEWLDYYSLLAPDAVKVNASTPAEVQGLVVFAEMAMQQGAQRLLIADVEGIVKAVGAAWAAFLVRSLVRVAKRHGAPATMTLNPERLTERQLEVIMGSSGTATFEIGGMPDRIPLKNSPSGRAG